ncbi:MAG TPA: hypothetical protein V6D33_10685 [Cyanophyceae cyanobacterium]
MYYEMREESNRPSIWTTIDPLKVKQRINRITAQLEGVLRKLSPQIENDDSQEKN